MTPVRLEPATLRSRVKHSTTEPLKLYLSCADPDSFIRGGPATDMTTFFVVVFVFCSWWEKRRKNPMPLMRTSETPLNAFLWRADDGPTLNAGFAAL